MHVYLKLPCSHSSSSYSYSYPYSYPYSQSVAYPEPRHVPIYLPNAAAGYARSRFFLGAAELLLELALLAGVLCMSAGRSFHSMSGRAVWNDVPGPGLRFGEGPLLLRGGPSGGESMPGPAFVVAASAGGVGACCFKRLAAAAVALGAIASDAVVLVLVLVSVSVLAFAPFADKPSAALTGLAAIWRRTIQALSGLSLK